MYGPGQDILVIRPAGIPASAYMAALGVKQVIIAGQSFSPDELDAVQAAPVDPCAIERLSTDAIAVDNFPEPTPRIAHHTGILPTLERSYRGDTDWRDSFCEDGYNAEDHTRIADEEHDTSAVKHGDGTTCADRGFCKSV